MEPRKVTLSQTINRRVGFWPFRRTQEVTVTFSLMVRGDAELTGSIRLECEPCSAPNAWVTPKTLVLQP